MAALTLVDAAKILKEMGLELPTSDRVEFLHGLEVESERLDSLGGDWTAVGHVVLDHLREDRAYYRKLKKALREHYDEQAERAAWHEAHESGRSRQNPDKSSDPTVVEYAMRMMQKGKSPKQAAAVTKKKLHGGENLMLGPGTVEIDERALEEALYARILESAQYGLSRGWTPEDSVRGALQGTCYSSFDDKTLTLVEQTIPEVVKRMHRKNPAVKLSEAALSALEVYVTDPAFVEADPTDDEGIVVASRQILESLNGSTLTTPDASDPERCWAWHARFSYAAESAMESDDHGAAKSLNALASKCIAPLREKEAAMKTRKNPSADRAAFSIIMGPRKGMKERIASFALRLSDEDLKTVDRTFGSQGPAIWGYWVRAMDARKKAGMSVPAWMEADTRKNPRRKPAERKNPRRKSEEHRIYVANLAAYNSGRLKGQWIEPSTDPEELAQQIVEAIGGNPDHEWAIHDYDSFPNMGENPDLKDVSRMAEILEQHPLHIVKAAQKFASADDMDELEEWLEEGYGTYESERDYVEQYVDDAGGPSALGKQTIDTYFDYESLGHDVSLEADEEDRERFEGMSDQEIGEEVIENYGRDIPSELADRYFDYDSFARDVCSEVASVRVPGEGLVVFNKR